MDNKNSIGFQKEALVLVPLLGSAIAITYDVGYFTGIDISFFSIFSISEHINFALQALPSAVLMAIGIAALAYTQPKFYRAKKPSYVSARPFLLFLVFAEVASLALFIVAVWTKLFITISAASVLAFLTANFLSWTKAMRAGMAQLVFWGVLSVLVGTYVFGLAKANAYLHEDRSVTIQTASAAVKAKIIRSGDRGVLFYDQVKRQITFVLWSQIYQISSEVR
jgi:hypothetical protein